MKKIKAIGDRWEREVAKELGGRRQPSSGAFGTQHEDASLTGDVVVKYPFLARPFHVECKYGYGGKENMTIKREWFEKVRDEASKVRRYPAVALKFRDVPANTESARVICLNMDVWKRLMAEMESLYLEYLSLLKERYGEDAYDK